MTNLDNLLDTSKDTLKKYADTLKNLPVLKLDHFDPKSTLLILMDMNNGFSLEGALSSPRVKDLIPKIELLTFRCLQTGIHTVAFTDTHSEQSREFNAYPPHCVRGSGEEKLVDELDKFKTEAHFHIIEKNSTNAFHIFNPFDEFRLLKMEYIENIIVVGCVTDICVYQFATTLMTYIHQYSLPSKVIVPVSMVDTFDIPGHNADLFNLIYLNSMAGNGITLARDID